MGSTDPSRVTRGRFAKVRMSVTVRISMTGVPTLAIERLNEEFRRRIKTQTVLPTPETVPMLFWALMASGQIQMRKVDGSETLDQPLAESLDLAG